MGVKAVVDYVTPRCKREFNAESEKAQRRLSNNDGAETHRAVDDKLRNYVGDKMLEDTVLYADTAGFGRSHEFLLAEREYLTAHKTRDPRQPRNPRMSIR